MDRSATPALSSRRVATGVAASAALAVGVALWMSASSSAPVVPAARAASPKPALEASLPPPLAAITPERVAVRARAAHFVHFEPNRGQADAKAHFIARSPQLRADVRDDGVDLTPARAEGPAATARLRFANARRGGTFEARERAEGHANYLVGNDPSRWLRDLPYYKQLRYADLYEGIDLVYYSRDGDLEYDFVVKPGADPSRIRMKLAGKHTPRIDAAGDLLLDGAEGALRLHKPVLYQHIDGEKKTLEGSYVLLARNEIGFRLPAYDRTKPLIIDPIFKLLYSTYLTGFHDEQVGGMALDAQSNAYVVGRTNSDDFVVSGNALQTGKSTTGLQYNIVVTKFDASGTLIYSTYLGGTGSDIGSAIAVDAAGNAYVTGNTTSRDFPVTPGAQQAAFTGSLDAYLAIVSPDGSALTHSTLYGGTGSVQANAIALDAAGAIVLSGIAGSGLATTPGAYKTTLAAGDAAFVAKFSALAGGSPRLLAATYFGVDNPEVNSTARGNTALSMALDASGAPWITGQSFTTNLPVTPGALQARPAAMSPTCEAGPGPLNSFAFVARLSADLGSLLYSSYLTGATEPIGGAACSEFGRALVLDAGGNVYVTGGTASAAFPTTVGTAQPVFPSGTGFASFTGFVTKLKPDGSAILWSTYLGGNGGNTFPAVIATDAAANAIWTTSVTAGGSNYPITSDAVQATHGGGGADAGLVQLDAVTGALRYSTFLGGNSADVGLALAVNAGGNAFVAGNTFSANFPLTPNAFETTYRPDFFGGADWFFSVVGGGSITALFPTSAGNSGDATVTISGAGIAEGAVASLVGASGAPIEALGPARNDRAGRWPFTFALDGAPAGSYELQIRNPDGSVLRRPAAFAVIEGQGPKLAMTVTGRETIRVGRAAPYQLVLSNTGDSDAYFAVVQIGLPAGLAVQYRFADLPPAFAGDTTDYKAVTGTTVKDGVAYTSVFFPIVPVGASASLHFEVTANDDSDAQVEAILLPSYVRSIAELRRSVGLSAGREFAMAAATSRMQPALTSQQASKCASSVILLGAGAVALAAGLGTGGVLAASMAVLTGVVASSLVNGPGGSSVQSQTFDAAQNVAQSFLSNTLQNVWNTINVVNDCDPDESLRARILYNIKPRPSIDPNDISGPLGDGSAAHFLNVGAPMSYQIAFENLPTAPLPAADVVVTDTLDPTLFDLTSLRLGSISWGSFRIDVPPGLSSYNTVHPIDATMSVRVQGSLNPGTGVLKWTFTTIDPATKLPPSDPTLGFLPPNADGRKGQAYVNFTVTPKAALPEGTQWRNSASIVFDTNPAIVTPTWLNVLDTTAPTSRIRSLTGKVGTTSFDVAWASAADNGAAGRTYSVFVSVDGAPYAVWQRSVDVTTATYDGASGHGYAFHVVATDGAGNAEPAKTTAEASISVDGAFAEQGNGSGGGGCTIGGGDQRDASLPLLVLLAASLLFISRRRAATRRHRAEG